MFKSLILIGLAAIAFFLEVIQTLLKMWQEIVAFILPMIKIILLAFVGGLVDYLTEEKTKKSWRGALTKGFISGFAGVLVGFICKYFNVDDYLMLFLVGLSGYAGTRALSFLENITKKTVERMATLRFTDDNNVQVKEYKEVVKYDNKEEVLEFKETKEIKEVNENEVPSTIEISTKKSLQNNISSNSN